MSEILFGLLMTSLVVFLVIAAWPSPPTPWQDSGRLGAHMKDCGDCNARRSCSVRESYERYAQR